MKNVRNSNVNYELDFPNKLSVGIRHGEGHFCHGGEGLSSEVSEIRSAQAVNSKTYFQRGIISKIGKMRTQLGRKIILELTEFSKLSIWGPKRVHIVQNFKKCEFGTLLPYACLQSISLNDPHDSFQKAFFIDIIETVIHFIYRHIYTCIDRQ